VGAVQALPQPSGPVFDKNYGTDGFAHIGFDLGSDNDDVPGAATLLPDGRMLIGGTTSIASAAPINQVAIAAVVPNGKPDLNFGDLGRLELQLVPTGGYGYIGDVAATTDGRIALIGGYHDNAANPDSTFIAISRLNSDGTPDTGFNLHGNRSIPALELLPGATTSLGQRVLPLANGKLLGLGVAANFDTNAFEICSGPIRVNSDGSLDASFANGVGYACHTTAANASPTFEALDMLVQPDGKILLAGTGNQPSNPANLDMAVLRLLADGNIDTAFGNNGWAFVAFDEAGSMLDVAQAMSIDSTGRILLAGYLQGASSTDWAVTRLLASGQVDTTFGAQGRVEIPFDQGDSNNDAANGIASLPDGRILVSGRVDVGSFRKTMRTYDSNFAGVVMLNADGSLDMDFGIAGKYVIFASDIEFGPHTLINPIRSILGGDSVYLPGTSFKAGAPDEDFGAVRLILPIFTNGFEGGALR
jgi:uncharacterized delta-60 repeat protein